MTKKLVKRNENTLDRYAFEPSDLSDLEAISRTFHASQLANGSLNVEGIKTVLIKGRELGLSMMQSIESIHIVSGKCVISASLLKALCLGSPECEFFRDVDPAEDLKALKRELKENTSAALKCLIEDDIEEKKEEIKRHKAGEIFIVETKRRSNPKPERVTWTIDQARAANLAGKTNWKNHPRQMLRARATSELARSVYPDVVAGTYTEDEAREIEDRENAVEVRVVEDAPSEAREPKTALDMMRARKAEREVEREAENVAEVVQVVEDAEDRAPERAEKDVEFENASNAMKSQRLRLAEAGVDSQTIDEVLEGTEIKPGYARSTLKRRFEKAKHNVDQYLAGLAAANGFGDAHEGERIENPN